MLSQSFNRSILKSANKTRLDSTRFTTWTGSNFNNHTTVFDEMQGGSKLDQAYRRTRTLIDELIGAVEEKRELSRIGAKNVGDTNQSVLDACQNEDIFTCPPPPTSIRAPEKHLISQIDLEKLELLKVIESQREYNQNLERKCHKLENENQFFRQSCASTKLGYSRMNSPLRAQQTIEQVPQNMEVARLFAQLQSLKYENQILRQQTINLLKSNEH